MYEVGQHIVYLMGRNQAIDEVRARTGDLDFEFHAVILRIDGRYLKVRLTNEPFTCDVEWIVDEQVIGVCPWCSRKTECKTD